MCVACHWANFGAYAAPAPEARSDALTRRQALRRGAAFAAAGIIPAPTFVAQAVAADDGIADIVFRNGAVYTVSDDKPWARAVAVKGKRIVFVGDDGGVQASIGPKTRVVDLAGKMLLPGFVEGHFHPLVGSTITRGADLQFDTKEEILAALKAYADKSYDGGMLRGFGWRNTVFPPTGPRKEDLDALWPDVPVYLIAIDGHSAWVNSQALALAGITRDAKDPVPGFSVFERDQATGEPTGFLIEVPAMMMVMNAIEPFSADFVAKSLEEWVPSAAAAGITSLFDAGMVLVPATTGFGIYARLEREGKLPFRVVGSFYHFNPAVDPIPEVKALKREFQSELVKASVLKLNIDGGEPARTAALLAPYADAPLTSGDTLLPPDVFFDIVARADREGIDVHVHSWGDRATRLTLDAFEAAIKANPPRDRRHAMAHLFLVDPADLPRFGKLGVTAQFSAQWAVVDPFQRIPRERVGLPRADETYRFGSVLRHGGVVAFGTDWPAANYFSTHRPLDAIEIATTRRVLGKPEAPQLAPADEVLGLAAALKASTWGPARQLGMDRDVGTIEVGKLADLVVLEKNLFEVAPQDIHKTRVLMTVMNGRVTHDAV